MDDNMTAAASRKSERLFFTVMACALAVGVFAGFARTFYLSPLFPEAREFIPPEAFFSFHGAVFTAWIIVLLAQVWLIRANDLPMHRKLGIVGGMLAVAVVIVGVVGAVIAAKRGTGFIGAPIPPEGFVIVPLLDMVLFGLYVFLALRWRADSQSHKRLMLLATLSICQAAFVRIPFPPLGDAGGPFMQMTLTILFVAVMAVWDKRTLGQVHRVTLWAGTVLVISQPLKIAVASTAAFQSLGRALLGIG